LTLAANFFRVRQYARQLGSPFPLLAAFQASRNFRIQRGRPTLNHTALQPWQRCKVGRQVVLDGEALVKVPREERGKRPLPRL